MGLSDVDQRHLAAVGVSQASHPATQTTWLIHH